MSAYDTIDFRPNWTVLAFLAFGGVVLFLLSLGYLSRAYRGFTFWSRVLWIFLPGLSLVGSLSAVIALWRGRRAGFEGARGAAWAFILNATVLFSCLMALFLSRLF